MKRSRTGRLLCFLGLMALTLGFIACNQAETRDAIATEPRTQPKPPREPVMEHFTPASPEVKQLAEGNNTFAVELYSKLKGGEGNLFFSPYSISSALSMTYGGARTQTAAEMEKVLRLAKKQQVHPVFAQLNASLDEAQKAGNVQLCVANSLWPQKGCPFNPEFISLVEKNYAAATAPLEFDKDPEGARKIINDWVENKTKNKITELIPRNVLQGAMMVLVNAIYFKGNWAQKFDSKKTLNQEFKLLDGGTKMVPMMNKTNKFGHAWIENVASILELPYAGNRLSMIVILPADPKGLPGIEDQLSSATLASWLGKISQPEEMRVSLPKFKITWGTTELKGYLASMGMPTPFSMEADFSGMDGSKNLYIGHVFHKAFVDVNEEGTEAAAATAVIMLTKGGGGPPHFIADHPFLFLIRDKASGSILFMGRVMDPSKE